MSRPCPAAKRRDQEPIERIRSLAADKFAKVEDFVDFLRQREHDHGRAARDAEARAVIEELRAMRRRPVREDVLYDERGQPRL